MTEIQTKKCAHCGRELPMSDFNHCSRSANGYQSWCRECSNEAVKKAQKAKKEKALKAKKEIEHLAEGKVVDPEILLSARKEGYIPGECEISPMPALFTLGASKQKSKVEEKPVESEIKKVSVKNGDKTLKDATPRELMAELKKRGFVWTDMTYTEVHKISYANI